MHHAAIPVSPGIRVLRYTWRDRDFTLLAEPPGMMPSGQAPNATPLALGDRSRPSATPADLRRRAHSRLAEKIDPARTRHKPLSLLRQEARRTLEALFETEAILYAKAERDRLVEDVLAEAAGLGTLEELFRDEAVKEIMVLTPHQVLMRKTDGWLPTSVRFRDGEQLRSVVARYAAVGEPVLALPEGAGGYDVKLTNGFRVIAIVPPEAMGHSPIVHLLRGPAVEPTPSGALGAPVARGWSATVRNDSVIRPGLPSANPPGSGVTAPIPAPRPPSEQSPPKPPEPVPTSTQADLFYRTRQQITARIVRSLAAAGLYDLNRIPLPEFRRIVLAHVVEYSEAERLEFDDRFKERLALEILANMNR